jgi:hypothetical protein
MTATGWPDGAVYSVADGVLTFDATHLRALCDHAVGRRIDPGAMARLAAAGVLVGGEVDAPIRPIVAALTGGGARLRLVTRCAGALAVTDAAFGDDGAALVLRPPGATAFHVRWATVGGVARHLARRLGIGGHLLAAPPPATPQALPDWPTVRAAFDTSTPSGWAARHDRAELHDLRWAPPGVGRARSALVVARLDGALAEVRPGPDEDTYLVTAADPVGVWCRLSSTVRRGHP